jgi:hypothetical protein
MAKEFSIIKKEIEGYISSLEKRDVYNTQVIEELDRLLNVAKYGSVGHANKVVRLSTLRNYKLRVGELIQMLKECKDTSVVAQMITIMENMAKDSKTNLKSANESLNIVEIFSNDYIKNEILAKTYKDLADLYDDVEKFLKSLVEETPESEMPVQETQPEIVEPVRGPLPGKPTKKTDKEETIA